MIRVNFGKTLANEQLCAPTHSSTGLRSTINGIRTQLTINHAKWIRRKRHWIRRRRRRLAMTTEAQLLAVNQSLLRKTFESSEFIDCTVCSVLCRIVHVFVFRLTETLHRIDFILGATANQRGNKKEYWLGRGPSAADPRPRKQLSQMVNLT